MEKPKFDVFISHASEDKDSLVRKVAHALELRGYSVWYDEFTLKLGDSLIEQIQKGIRDSRFGLLVLSKDFLKKIWTQKELNAILTKEIIANQSVILPIWHGVSHAEVFDYSPLVADRLAINTASSSFDELITRIADRIKTEKTTNQDIKKKIDSIINYNDDEKEMELLKITGRMDTIFLYQKGYYNHYTTHPLDDSVFSEEEMERIENDRELEYRKKYGLPPGVWATPEPFSKNDLARAKTLLKKWIHGKLSEKACSDLLRLLDGRLDSDVSYILYGFPYGTLDMSNSYDFVADSVYRVGNRKRR